MYLSGMQEIAFLDPFPSLLYIIRHSENMFKVFHRRDKLRMARMLFANVLKAFT